jgi:hypothetical protein
VISTILQWPGHEEKLERQKNVFMTLVGKPAGKYALGRPKRMREDNVRGAGGGRKWLMTVY